MRKLLSQTCVKVSGNPAPGKLSLAFEFSPEAEEIRTTRGKLFGALEIFDGGEEIDTALGKSAVDFLEETYFTNLAGSNLTALKEALGKAVEYVRERFHGGTVNINVALAVVWGEIVYLAIAGRGKVNLLRQGNLTTLLCDDKSEFVQGASGYAGDRDILVLQTDSFGQIVSGEQLKSLLTERDPAEAAEALVPLIHSEAAEGGGAGAAAVILQFKVAEVPSEEEMIRFTVPEEMVPQQIIPTALPVAESGVKLAAQMTGIRQKIIGKTENFLHTLFAKTPARRPVYLISGYQKTSNKKAILLVLAVLVFLVLIIAVVQQLFIRQSINRSGLLKEGMARVEKKMDIGMSLKGLNDPLARSTLLEAKGDLTELAVRLYGKEWESSKNADLASVRLLQEKIGNNIAEIARIYKVDSPTTFYDVSFLKDNAKISAAVLRDGRITAIDRDSGTVFQVDDKTKAGTLIAGDENFRGAKFVGVRADLVYIFADKGIYQINTLNNKKSLAISSDSQWQEIGDLATYAGNIYLLDKKAGQIWKYMATENGLSTVRNYLNTDIKPDFSQALSLAIDGSVYVLRADGNIVKYTQGQPDPLTLSGLDKPLSNPRKIIAADDLDKIYLWDAGNNRIVTFDQKGEYFSQYQFKNDFKPADFLVDEAAKKLFLLSGSKIYSVDLK